MKLNNRGKVGIVILIIILLIGFLGCAGYIVYDKFLSKEKTKEEVIIEDTETPSDQTPTTETKNEKVECKEKNYIVMNSFPWYEENREAHIYATDTREMVYAINGELLYGEDPTNATSVDLVQDDNKIFSFSSLKKLDIKESDVLKVVMEDDIINRGVKNNIFVIYKDGRVYNTSTDTFYTTQYDKFILSEYKVKDIEQTCMETNNEVGCVKMGYKITLKDGSTKIVEAK